MKQIKILILIIAVIIIAIVAIIKFILPTCENEIIKNVDSQDGRYTAILYSRGCGATVDDYMHINIKRNGTFLWFKKDIFTLKGYTTRINANWDGSTLTVSYPEGSELLRSLDKWRDITVRYNPVPKPSM